MFVTRLASPNSFRVAKEEKKSIATAVKRIADVSHGWKEGRHRNRGEQVTNLVATRKLVHPKQFEMRPAAIFRYLLLFFDNTLESLPFVSGNWICNGSDSSKIWRHFGQLD
jgi:hypothetical protein